MIGPIPVNLAANIRILKNNAFYLRPFSMLRTVHIVAFFCAFLFCTTSSRAQLVASFTADDTSICAPNIVNFTNTSTGATSYSWDLGNGVTSSSRDVSGTYGTPGTYIVKMTAFAGASSKTYTLSVNAYGKPTVNFTASPRSICPGSAVSFTNGSIPNCWGTLTYTWNFGEGGSGIAANPTYSYSSPGSYNVTLLAQNNGGCVSTLSMPNYIFVYTPAAIGFGASLALICKVPNNATFTNTTTGTGTLAYTWSFGDGGASGLKTPAHTYTTPGATYDVTLSVRDGNGCVDSMTRTGLITTGTLAADFYTPHDSCLFTQIKFYNKSSPHSSSKWDFGDGKKSVSDTGVHTYNRTGVYNVKLVIDDGKCKDSITKTISIARPPISFAVTPIGACPPPIPLTLTASVPPGSTVTWSTYLWGNLGTGNPLTYTFPAAMPSTNPYLRIGEVDKITMYNTDAYGCRDTIKQVLDTINGLSVAISATRSGGCTPVTTTLSAALNSTVYSKFQPHPSIDFLTSFPYPYGIASYSWDFNDGSPTSTAPSPTHTFTAEGVYAVKCTMVTVYGCTMTGVDTIKAGNTGPTSTASLYPSRICAGGSVGFTSLTIGTATDYIFSFGDGGTRKAPSCDHMYTLPNTYGVTFTAYNNGCPGNTVFLQDTIDAPGAEIAIKYNCIPANRITFYDSSRGDDSRTWIFGDGSTSTLTNPVHDFPALTNYAVQIATYNTTTGCRDTGTYNVYLQRVQTNLLPSRTNVCLGSGDSVKADITNVYSGVDGLIKFPVLDKWYLNGVLFSTNIPVIVDGVAPIYSADSVYTPVSRLGRDTFTVILTNNLGCMDTAILGVTAARPTASFSYSPSTGCAPLNVIFRDGSVDAPGISLSNYTWDFGNGNIQVVTSTSTALKYTASGTYTVTEIVTDNIGCSDTLTRSDINITIPSVRALFSTSSQETCVGLDPGFDAGKSTFGTYQWKFGDGGTSSLVKPGHKYATPGVYDVTLIVSNGTCNDTSFNQAYLTVDPNPKASFTLSDSFAVCPPLSVNFTNKSTGATSYSWSFGDGTLSAATSPSDIYNSIGKYKIKLQAVNQYGCVDTAVAQASIFGYSGAFSYSPLKVCTSSPVNFTATISGVAKVKWDFADGIIDSSLLTGSIAHKYTTARSYIPTLILTDGAGCTSFSVGADTIRVDTLVAYYSVHPNPACMNSTVSFADSSYTLNTPVTSWAWQFGNGTTSTASAPAYTYTATGSYSVKLSVVNGAGCSGSITKTINVLAQPAANTGNASICMGATTTLSNSVTGGKWTTSNSSVAVIDSTTGIVSSVAPGTSVILYKIPSGCFSATTVTVNPMPDTIIAGNHRVCETYSYSLISDRTAGGTWSSSNTSIATIIPTTGYISGIRAGTTIISYTLSSGCSTSTSLTIDPTPAPIPQSLVCAGTTITLTDTPPGGVWTSSNTQLATVGSSSGIVTGVLSGVKDTTVIIVYTISSTCPVSAIVKVNPSVPAITGNHACVGSASPFSDASPGGTWSSSNTAIATVTFGSGLVTGQAQGTALITYTNTIGCIVTTTVTVDTLPPPVSGAKQVCKGNTITLSDGISGGAWSTTATVVVVNPTTGDVFGKVAGSAVISYTIATGCKTSTAVTVNALPTASVFAFNLCTGASATTFGNPSGGIWSSSNTSIFTVIAVPGLGVGQVTGVAPGTAVVSYTIPTTGCVGTTPFTIISLQAPQVKPPASSPELCAGTPIILTDTGGGTWSSSNTLIATAGASTGVVTGISTGTATISYIIASNGCSSALTVTVDPVPTAIVGTGKLCIGDTAIYTNSLTGGSWTSSAPAVATIGTATGKITGIAPGTATITYMMPTSCFITSTVIVNPLPLPVPGAKVCADNRIMLSDASSPGRWSSANTVVATIDPVTGSLLGANPGTVTITYQLTTGCLTTTAITVNAAPAPITGTAHICLGDTAVLADATPGGTWTSTDPGVADVRPDTAIVWGVSPGTATISYTLGTGCAVPILFTVYAVPTAIGGNTRICLGSIDTLTNTIPGTWTSDNTSVATIDINGAVTGVATGTAGITFTATGNCAAITTVTVYPVLAPIAGDTMLCIGATATLSEAVTGGLWNSSDTSVASIDALGILTGKAHGITVISYSLINSCGDATVRIFVAPLPYAGIIKGSDNVCTKAAIQLTDTIAGGVWSTGNSVLATVDTSGIITGVTPGVDTIYYTYANQCGRDKTSFALTVNQAAEHAHILVHPDTVLCGNTLFQNFGADSPEPPGGHYVWSADNGVVYAVSANRQNCLISFYAPGIAIVRLSSQFLSSTCTSEDTILYHIGDKQPQPPAIVYYDPEFVCTDYTSDSYQWGYDDAHTLDSVKVPGAVNQNYFEPSPDLKNKYYWVITHHKGCLQKSYYNVPLAIKTVAVDGLNIKLYPNPADETLYMEVTGMDHTATIGYRLLDVTGRERATGALPGGKGSAQLADLIPGVYMASFTYDGAVIGTGVFLKR